MPGGTLKRPIEDSGSSASDVCGTVPAVPRVYVVSDVRLYRDGLIASLAGESRLDVFGAGGSGDVLSQIAVSRPEVLLLDIAARDSLQIPRRARQALPGLIVVAFAVADAEEGNVLACAEAGISGYVVQDGSIEDLVTAVLCALKGEVVCSPQIAGCLFNRLATLSRGSATKPAAAQLTAREREIAALVACNLPNKEIARRLHLGPATIKNHVHNILQKLNIHRRCDIGAPDLWQADTAAQAVERR
jgi:two-component system, NarL family, nitrate/nitrite response regulator NarL